MFTGRSQFVRAVAALLVLVWFSGSGAIAQEAATAEASKPPALKLVGKLNYRPLVEISGIVASRKHDGVFWVHNDGGSGPAIYAVNREGKLLAEFPVAAINTDWEDIALDAAGRLYIADTGNNNRNRRQVTIYRLDEPDPKDQPPAGGAVRRLPITRQWTLEFPDRPFDCEAMFVLNGYGYLISKLFLAGKAGVDKAFFTGCNLALRERPERQHLHPSRERLGNFWQDQRLR